MNVKELNESVKVNQKKELEETIKEIENHIRIRANNGFNNFQIYPNGYAIPYSYRTDKWMFEPLKEYFENNGFKIKLKEMKSLLVLIEKLLGIYSPVYSMIISW